MAMALEMPCSQMMEQTKNQIDEMMNAMANGASNGKAATPDRKRGADEETSESNSNSKRAKGDRRNPEKDAAPSRVVHIWNIVSSVTEQELIDLGGKFGQVSNIFMLNNKTQAFLEFEHDHGAAEMVKYYNDIEPPFQLHGRRFYCQFSKRKELKIDSQPDDTGRKRGESRPEGKILHVSVENMLHPVALDTLTNIFKKHGDIRKIVTFTKSNVFQILIEYSETPEAKSALQALHGKNIYNSSCMLDIEFSKLTDVNVKYNNEWGWDFNKTDCAFKCTPPGEGQVGLPKNALISSKGAGGIGKSLVGEPPSGMGLMGSPPGVPPGGPPRGPPGGPPGGQPRGPPGGRDRDLEDFRRGFERGLPDRGFPHRGFPERGFPDRGFQDRGDFQDRGYPDRGYPDRGYQDRGYPDHGYPDHGYPDHGYPDHGYPDHGYPDHGYPDHGYPDHGYPDHGYPDHGYPDHGFPNHGFPDRGFSDHGFPDRGYPDRGYPDRGYQDRGYQERDRGSQDRGSRERGSQDRDFQERMQRHGDHGMHGMGIMGSKPPTQEHAGCVLIVSNIEERIANVDALFTLFGVYGDVRRIKILFNKKDMALIQMTEPWMVNMARQFLDRVAVYGKELRVSPSKYKEVEPTKKADSEGAELTRDFTELNPAHRYKKQNSKNSSNIFAPSACLHIANIGENAAEAEVQGPFEKYGEVAEFKFFHDSRKMAHITMGSVDEAIVALVNLHNYKICGKFIRLSFAKTRA